MCVCAGPINNRKKFFGAMAPRTLTTHHGYKYLKARAAADAPANANKELALMSTVSHYAVRECEMDKSPFMGMMLNWYHKDVHTLSRPQVLRF